MENKTIKESAQDIFKKYGKGIFPVRIIDIATAMNIRVVADADYARNKNGHIQLNNDNTYSIIVNNTQSVTRKRFTIAHEIAHFLFDKDYLEKHKFIDRDGDAHDVSYRRREKNANEFAAELLMPEDVFTEKWIELNHNTENISDFFGVSCDAVKYRAINIGLMLAE